MDPSSLVQDVLDDSLRKYLARNAAPLLTSKPLVTAPTQCSQKRFAYLKLCWADELQVVGQFVNQSAVEQHLWCGDPDRHGPCGRVILGQIVKVVIGDESDLADTLLVGGKRSDKQSPILFSDLRKIRGDGTVYHQLWLRSSARSHDGHANKRKTYGCNY